MDRAMDAHNRLVKPAEAVSRGDLARYFPG